MATALQGFVSEAGDGKVYEALGTRTTLRARGADTGGTFAVMEAIFPAGGGVPPHYHRQTDEAVYVLEGELGIVVGDRAVAGTPGTLTVFPRGTVHSFQNESDRAAKILLWTQGQGGLKLDQMLEDFNSLPPGPPDMEQLMPILERHDMVPVPPQH